MRRRETDLVSVDVKRRHARIAEKRGHPQAAAINVTSWLGIATLGVLWPLALIWAFMKPFSVISAEPQENQEAWCAKQEG